MGAWLVVNMVGMSPVRSIGLAWAFLRPTSRIQGTGAAAIGHRLLMSNRVSACRKPSSG